MADLPIHFVHGIKAVTCRDGQTAAALAEALIKGISQERVRRLVGLLDEDSPAIKGLPRDWARVLPRDAPLTTVARWEQAFSQAEPADWPDGIDRSPLVLGLLRSTGKGSCRRSRGGREASNQAAACSLAPCAQGGPATSAAGNADRTADG